MSKGGGARRTVARPARVAGRGLHTAAATTLTFRPAPSGCGLVFRRVDLPGHRTIPVAPDSVRNADRRTVLGRGGATVTTVEHVLAAVVAWELDDLLMDLDGPEPPAGDGSAAPYFDALVAASVREQPGPPARRIVRQPLEVAAHGAHYRISPAPRLRVSVTIEWDHAAVGRQACAVEISPATFGRALAGARTFGFAAERDALHARGLALGASPENTVVLTDTGLLHAELRWPDEFARHKALDLVGDLALLGSRLAAHVEARRPGHRSNLALVRALHVLPPEVSDP